MTCIRAILYHRLIYLSIFAICEKVKSKSGLGVKIAATALIAAGGLHLQAGCWIIFIYGKMNAKETTMKTGGKSAGKPTRKGRSAAKPSKPYWEMTTSELRDATAEFDREFVGDTFGPPSPEQHIQDARARRKRGRPRVGQGSQTISVTVEKRLLAQADQLAKRLQVPRAVLIARGLQAVVGEEVSL
jgi:hypothetical protein